MTGFPTKRAFGSWDCKGASRSCLLVPTCSGITPRPILTWGHLSKTRLRNLRPRRWLAAFPVITSATNGTAEIMTDGVDGLIVQDPNDVAGLAARIRRLYDEPTLRQSLGLQASLTAQKYTWDRNGEQIRAIFAEALSRKR